MGANLRSQRLSTRQTTEELWGEIGDAPKSPKLLIIIARYLLPSSFDSVMILCVH
jgi:hypothetical protein